MKKNKSPEEKPPVILTRKAVQRLAQLKSIVHSTTDESMKKIAFQKIKNLEETGKE